MMLNSTQVPNALLEAIFEDNFTEREAKVLLFVCRKTIGWHKETQWVTLDYLAKCLPKLGKTHASEVLYSLEEKGAIVREPHINGGWETNLSEKWGVPKSGTVDSQIGNHSIKKRDKLVTEAVASAPSMGLPPGVRVVLEGEREPKGEGKLSPAARKAYDGMIVWAEKERGAPFIGPRTKQYKALKMAKDAGLKAEQLMDRWQEMSEDPFWSDKGYDWMNVVSNLSKKPPTT